MWIKILYFGLVISSQALGQCYSGPIVWSNYRVPGQPNVGTGNQEGLQSGPPGQLKFPQAVI